MKFFLLTSAYIHQFQTSGFALPALICLFSIRDLSYGISCFSLGIIFYLICRFIFLSFLASTKHWADKETGAVSQGLSPEGFWFAQKQNLCESFATSCIFLHSSLSHFIWYLTALAIIFLRSFLVSLISLCTTLSSSRSAANPALDHQQTFPMLWLPWPYEYVMEFIQRALGLRTSWVLLLNSFTYSLHAGLSFLSSTLPA